MSKVNFKATFREATTEQYSFTGNSTSKHTHSVCDTPELKKLLAATNLQQG